MAGGSAAGSAAGSAGSVLTPDERRAVLDRRLDESLGSFDKTLAGEQARNAAERDSRAATGTGSAGDDDTAGSELGDGTLASAGGRQGDLRSENAGRDASTAAQGGQGESGQGESGGGSGRDRGTVSGAGSGGPDRSRPSGEDDDIVARRLRRAAEQETDPELKEKLWKEYEDYKRNARG
jgi:hypothetical protein